MTQPPEESVLTAFGVGEPVPLTGGEGTCWRAGDLVLKPEAGSVHDWWSTVASGLQLEGADLARPVRTRTGGWSVDGWSATTFLPARALDLEDVASLRHVLDAGRALHRATAQLPEPSVLRGRDDWWALADRAAWADRLPDLPGPVARVVERLSPLLRRGGGSQVVHGDLTGNVLMGTDGRPVVLDVSPYWRPASYAEGVVVADALLWHGAVPSVAPELEVPVGDVARGLLFRLLTDLEQVRDGARPADCVGLHRYDDAAAGLAALSAGARAARPG